MLPILCLLCLFLSIPGRIKLNTNVKETYKRVFVDIGNHFRLSLTGHGKMFSLILVGQA